MMLHHVVALALTVNSYIANTITVGIMVLIVHDCSDIFTSFMRVFGETKWFNSWPSIISYFLMMLSWCWLRLYAYFWVIYTYYLHS